MDVLITVCLKLRSFKDKLTNSCHCVSLQLLQFSAYKQDTFLQYSSGGQQFNIGFTPCLCELGCHNKVPQTLWLKQQEFIFSQFRKLKSQRSRFQTIWFLVRAAFLTYGRLPSLCVLTWCGKRTHSHEGTSPMIPPYELT